MKKKKKKPSVKCRLKKKLFIIQKTKKLHNHKFLRGQLCYNLQACIFSLANLLRNLVTEKVTPSGIVKDSGDGEEPVSRMERGRVGCEITPLLGNLENNPAKPIVIYGLQLESKRVLKLTIFPCLSQENMNQCLLRSSLRNLKDKS